MPSAEKGRGSDWQGGVKERDFWSHKNASFVMTHKAVIVCFVHFSVCYTLIKKVYIKKMKGRQSIDSMGEDICKSWI